MPESKHIVRAYDDELQQLNEMIGRMGGLAEAQIDDAIRAVFEHDTELAKQVARSDAKVDELEAEINALALKLLALRQPMAIDLRYILSALRIASDLERIADHAENMCRRGATIAEPPHPSAVAGIQRLGKLVLAMLKDVLDASLSGDTDKAVEVWLRDEEVDDLYGSLFREYLTYMMENPRNIGSYTTLLFVAKNVERIGDHVTNIAETIYFRVKAKPLKDSLPDRDEITGESD
ncbi:MAG: phosphate signaling complex protein PhoU [Proteobacteria bacterium]|nr:phosphate signaling complex protein PhoU [Pseudomonadota bacterium]MCK4867797.1 phosphate signaling complex protein PhoU [Alphaproteobacteria bacterium]